MEKVTKPKLEMPIPYPETLSGLVRLAVDDLEKCEADKRYRIKMDECHHVRDQNVDDPQCMPDYVCEVCFAGSVMAQSGGVPLMQRVYIDSYTREWKQLFWVLDDLRRYDLRSLCPGDGVREPLATLLFSLTELQHRIRNEFETAMRAACLLPYDYKQNPTVFKQAMRIMADVFEKFEKELSDDVA